MKTTLAWIGALALLALAVLSAAIATGLYDVGADSPNAAPVEAVIAWARMRSVAHRAEGTEFKVPPDPSAIRHGARHYAEMCAGCHLSPDAEDRDLHDGLYPRPPDLTKQRVDPGVAFWTIKHGVKMTAMPAWGQSHDDATIKAIVAFVEALPTMSAGNYRAAIAPAEPTPGADAEQHSHHHHH